MKNPYEEIERNIARTIDYLTGITQYDSAGSGCLYGTKVSDRKSVV